ncbi:MAG: thiopurine S-methyltransferase [Methylomonas sp.]
MDNEFWYERWRQNQIGFHKAEINPYLQDHWPKLAVQPGGRVLVPLCGKSNDMLWLLARGYQVIGIELSPLAVEAFFSENRLQPTVRRQGDFLISEISGLQIYCGDFFALQSSVLGKIDAIYDRAALVALPHAMRNDYVAHLSALTFPGLQILLITFNYPQLEMPGPPFSVPAEEVAALFQGWCATQLLADVDIISQELQFKQRGLSRLHEQVYRLTVNRGVINAKS